MTWLFAKLKAGAVIALAVFAGVVLAYFRGRRDGVTETEKDQAEARAGNMAQTAEEVGKIETETMRDIGGSRDRLSKRWMRTTKRD